MTLYTGICKQGLLTSISTRGFDVPLGTEKDSGVKHTHFGNAGVGYSIQKGPTDYLFNVTLTIQNVVDGSRWHVSKVSDGTVLGTGVQSGTGDIEVQIGYLGSPFNVRIKIRNASGATKYKPFETQAQITANGASAYIIQTED